MKSLVELAALRRDAEQRKDREQSQAKTKVRWIPTYTYYRCGWNHGQLRRVTRYRRVEEAVCDPST